MKIIRNRLIPFKGCNAINLFGVLWVRGQARVTQVDLNHERIHTAQMRELGYILFYVLYLVEWMVRLPMPGNAYRNISMEREAYGHQGDLGYLSSRRHYAWLHYMRKTKQTHKKS